jgi:hypothetical protein
MTMRLPCVFSFVIFVLFVVKKILHTKSTKDTKGSASVKKTMNALVEERP